LSDVKFEFSRYILKKILIKFHKNVRSGSRVPCGQMDGRTDGHDEANSRLPQFCKWT